MNSSQARLLEEMQEAGFNVVNCGNCGSVFIHKTGVEELECPICNFKDDISSFPDLYYYDGEKNE